MSGAATSRSARPAAALASRDAAGRGGAARLRLTVQFGARCPQPGVSRARLRRWVVAALERDARLTLRFVAAAEGRTLNREFRGRDYATNVLTFAYPAVPGEPLEADIVVCLPVVRREARAQRKAPDAHLAHLVVHGVLHAQGWDHDDAGEARRMEALETRVLRRFGIEDPYREVLPRARVRLSSSDPHQR